MMLESEFLLRCYSDPYVKSVCWLAAHYRHSLEKGRFLLIEEKWPDHLHRIRLKLDNLL